MAMTQTTTPILTQTMAQLGMSNRYEPVGMVEVSGRFWGDKYPAGADHYRHKLVIYPNENDVIDQAMKEFRQKVSTLDGIDLVCGVRIQFTGSGIETDEPPMPMSRRYIDYRASGDMFRKIGSE